MNGQKGTARLTIACSKQMRAVLLVIVLMATMDFSLKPTLMCTFKSKILINNVLPPEVAFEDHFYNHQGHQDRELLEVALTHKKGNYLQLFLRIIQSK